jgi:hypothetical protein
MIIRTRNLLTAFLFTAASGSALADYDHVPLRRIDGFVVHSSTSVSNFTLNEGRYSSCEISAGGLSVTKCQLEGASLSMTGRDGVNLTLPLSRLAYFESSTSGQVYHHYIYKGIWSITQNGRTLESDFALDVIYTGDGSPDKVRGYLSMDDLNVSEQIRGQAYPQ